MKTHQTPKSGQTKQLYVDDRAKYCLFGGCSDMKYPDVAKQIVIAYRFRNAMTANHTDLIHNSNPKN